jgi:hypothetical protein
MPSFSTSSTIGAIDRNLPGLRRLRRDLADTATGSGTPTDVVVIGDSITRGFNAGADKSWTRVFRAELKRLYGFPAGGIGHRISNSNEYEPTTFAYAGTAANVTGIGPGGLATNLPYSAVQANSAAIAITADRYLIHYLPQNTFGASRLSSAAFKVSIAKTTITAFGYRCLLSIFGKIKQNFFDLFHHCSDWN